MSEAHAARTVLVETGDFREADAGTLERAVRMTLAEEGVHRGEVSVALLGDEAIRALNREHLGRDRPTDVIAFALHGEGPPGASVGDLYVVGDVYLGYEEALRNAADAEVPVEEELVRLAVHGTLHVLGHDHPEEASERDGSPMYRLQEELVERVLTGAPEGS